MAKRWQNPPFRRVSWTRPERPWPVSQPECWIMPSFCHASQPKCEKTPRSYPSEPAKMRENTTNLPSGTSQNAENTTILPSGTSQKHRKHRWYGPWQTTVPPTSPCGGRRWPRGKVFGQWFKEVPRCRPLQGASRLARRQNHGQKPSFLANRRP